MKIAIFDYYTTLNNPVGSCNRVLLQNLCEEHNFTVFSVEFDNPRPDRIRWMVVPAVRKPLFLLFVSFHINAAFLYLLDYFRGGRYDLAQFTSSNFTFGKVSYVHFGHGYYLRHFAKEIPLGLYGVARWLDHALHAFMERLVFPRLRYIVVPSQGLQRELVGDFPKLQDRIKVIPNPVNLDNWLRPDDFDRNVEREKLGLPATKPILVFAALGHFERKGLSLVLEAVQRIPGVWLLVVGGDAELVKHWREITIKMDLAERVIFTGFQKELRSYFWLADGFVFPSAYETFSLVTFQAAAAGLPVIVSQLYGVEEWVKDQETGYVVERNSEHIATAIKRLIACSPVERQAFGAAARKAVLRYSADEFARNWRAFYERLV